MQHFLKNLCMFAGSCLAVGMCYGAATTEPFGVVNLTFDKQSDTYVSLSFHRTAVFRGTIADTSVGADTVEVTVSGTPNWGADVLVDGNDTYYMLVCDGPLNAEGQPAEGSQEGAFVTVIGNGSNTLEFDADEFNFAITDRSDLLDANGDQTPGDGVLIKLIPYWTLATLFPDQQGIVPRTSNSGLGYSEVMLPFVPDANNPDSVGVGEVGKDRALQKRYYYYDDPVSDNFDGWYDTQDESQTVDHAPINPSVFLLVRNVSNEDLSVIHYGAVYLNAIRVPIGNLMANTAQDNAVGFSVPVPTKLKDLNLVPGVIQPATDGNPNADELIVYTDDLTGIEKAASHRFTYYDGFGWYDNLDNEADDFEIQPGDALVIRKRVVDSPSFVWWTYLYPEALTLTQ
jgi:uncharacterized protein (TIGR02597 family)